MKKIFILYISQYHIIYLISSYHIFLNNHKNMKSFLGILVLNISKYYCIYLYFKNFKYIILIICIYKNIIFFENILNNFQNAKQTLIRKNYL